MTYTFTCDQGHEPMAFTVEAENDDEALQKIMEQARPHIEQVHPELANMPEDQARNIITGNWRKE